MERKKVFYYSFEDLYDASPNPQGDAGVLALTLLKYYGFFPLVAFTVATNAPQGASPIIIFHVGNEEDPIFESLEEYYEEDNDYYDAVEDTIEDIEEGFEEEEKDMIGIIVFDGYNTGIAIGVPR
ncbi:MAG: hypothetical protein RXN93_09310 [Thermocladium sp.]